MDPSKSEAERLIGIAEKLLQSRDLVGCRDFAILAQETSALLDGPDQILAVADVILASEKPVSNKTQHDWYAILQVDRRCDDLDLIKKQYRRLALLLHPDKNRFSYAEVAFKMVADAWAFLSEPSSKARFDQEIRMFSKVDLLTPNLPKRPPTQPVQDTPQRKLPVRRTPNPRGGNKKKTIEEDNVVEDRDEGRDRSSFWTTCPYCYLLFEYPRVFEDCCLRCQNCRRAFHAAVISSLPPIVPGKEAYYCCWGIFPLGFSVADSNGDNNAEGFPNWMPPIFPNSKKFV